jgi:predicted permease
MHPPSAWRPYVRPIQSNLHADIDDEFAFHIDMLTEELVASGLSPAEARAEAERRFGAWARAAEACLEIDQRRVRRAAWRTTMSALVNDVRYTLRSMRKNPTFTAAICLTLALGIGATTAMFAVVDGVLLRRLPYPSPDRIAMLFKTGDHSEVELPLSYPDYLDVKARTGAIFSDVAAWAGASFQIVANGQAELLTGSRVSANMAEFLGVKPILGRSFRPEEEDVSAPRVAMIGERWWRDRFGASPNVIGRTITMSGFPYTIIGVLPAAPGARVPSDLRADQMPAFWIPLRLTTKSAPRDLNFMNLAGRLKPGVSLDQARSGLAAMVATLKQDGVDLGGVSLATLTHTLTGSVAKPLGILLAAVGMLLLISCANVANLLLARAAARQRELGVRVAIGASRGRILAQLLAEALVQATIGGGLGVLLALGITAAARRWLSLSLPRYDSVRIDGRVLAFTAALSLFAGVVFGLAPAVRTARADLIGALRDGGRGLFGSVSRDRLRRTLVTIEVALSFVLLVGAGLLIRSLAELLAVKPGFDPEHVTTAQIGLPATRYPDSAAISAFYARFGDALRSLPGVQNVAFTSDLPGRGGTWGGVLVQGVATSEKNRPTAEKRIVSTDYFQTLHAHAIAGRLFSRADAGGAPVVIVNRTFVEQYLAGRTAVGLWAEFLWGTDAQSTIVGVVDDVREGMPDVAPRPAIYIPAEQRPEPWLHVLVRSSLDEASVVRAVRSTLTRLDPQLALSGVTTLEDYLSGSVDSRREPAKVLGAFAVLAAVLAAIGLYGVMSYSVAQRAPELGIRAALGARPADQVRLVMMQGGAFVVAGIVVGVVLAVATTRFMASQLFGVRPTDLATFAVVATLLAAVSTVALALPARRATRTDPATALRAD